MSDNTKNKLFTVRTPLLILAVIVAMMMVTFIRNHQSPIQKVEAQAYLNSPYVFATPNAGPSASNTAGTINNGGHPVTVAAASTGLTASKADCSSPNYANCNFLIANSAGTVSNTTTVSTAFAAGNTLLAFIETGATTVTQIVYPQQGSIPYTGGVNALMDCGTTTSCASATLIQGMGVKVAIGTATLSGGTVTVTGLSFGSGATFGCAVAVSGATNTTNVASYQVVSGSSIAIKETNNGADTIHFTCVGY